MVAAREHRIKQKRVDVTLKIPAIHLYGKLVTEDKDTRLATMFHIVIVYGIRNVYNLLQTLQMLIHKPRQGKVNIGKDMNTLLHKLLPLPAPHHFAVLALILPRHDLMHRRKRLAPAKHATETDNFTCFQAVISTVEEIQHQITDAIINRAKWVAYRTTERREQEEQEDGHDENQQNQRLTPPNSSPIQSKMPDITRTKRKNRIRVSSAVAPIMNDMILSIRYPLMENPPGKSTAKPEQLKQCKRKQKRVAGF